MEFTNPIQEAINNSLSAAPLIAALSCVYDENEEDKIKRLEFQLQQLTAELAAERKLRYDIEQKYEELKAEMERMKQKKCKKNTQSEKPTEYNPYKSDGKLKARPAESIRSYEDFVAIQQYFLERNKIRDWALWTVGVCLGVRISDLLSLKVKHVLKSPRVFRERVTIIEQKTSKANNCLITEAVVDALTRYFDSIKWKFSLEDYLFPSKKTGGKMYEEYGWKIISDAGKALNLPIVIGSHTMRKSFANIAACVDHTTVDMNSITKIQGLLNHSNQQTTLKYLGTYQRMFDAARVAVSDFVLGKTDAHELLAGDTYNMEDIFNKLDDIESRLK